MARKRIRGKDSEPTSQPEAKPQDAEEKKSEEEEPEEEEEEDEEADEEADEEEGQEEQAEGSPDERLEAAAANVTEGEALSPPKQLLSDVVDQSIKGGIHKPSEFTDRFPPDAIMAVLKDEPKLRAKILVPCLNLPERTAMLLDANTAGAALAAAMKAGDTDAPQILEHFSPDDRVRYLPTVALWAFVDGDDWWKRASDESKAFMLFILERTQHHGLMNPDAWRDGITINTIAKKMPRNLLEKLFERAAALGAEKKPMTAAEIIKIAEPRSLVDSIALSHLHDRVVIPLAQRCEYVIVSSRPLSDKAPDDDTSTPDHGWSLSSS